MRVVKIKNYRGVIKKEIYDIVKIVEKNQTNKSRQ